MRRIEEVLRLKPGLGLSDEAVARSARIAWSTVKKYLYRAAAARRAAAVLHALRAGGAAIPDESGLAIG